MQGKKYFSLLPAYGLIASIFILSFLYTNHISAQEYSDFDSVKIGYKYKLILFDDTEIIGKLVSLDSVYMIVQTGKTNSKVRKDDILIISKDLIPSKYKFMFSVGGGLSFPAAEFFGVKGRDYKHSFAFQLNGSYLYKQNKALRLDFGYSRLKRKGWDYGYITSVEGGTADLFTAKIDLLVGELRPKYNIFAYALVGLGLHYTNLSETVITEYMSYDSTYHTYKYEENKEFNAVFGLGAGVGYKMTKSLGIYTEIQYTIATNKGSNIFGYDGGYIPVRFGLTYFLY